MREKKVPLCRPLQCLRPLPSYLGIRSDLPSPPYPAGLSGLNGEYSINRQRSRLASFSSITFSIFEFNETLRAGECRRAILVTNDARRSRQLQRAPLSKSMNKSPARGSIARLPRVWNIPLPE
jgi:hypothetical protein